MIALIVCARADEAKLMVKGTTADHFCHRCGTRVLTSPNSLKMLKDHPEYGISCFQCVLETHAGDTPVSTVTPAEDLAREIAGSVPNTWRGRN